MPLPPSVQRLLPSLAIDGGFAPGAKVTLSFPDFQALVRRALADVEVDETWYRSQYPDVADGIARGDTPSAIEHYRAFGWLEGRLPIDPKVDEIWYRANNPDVAAGIRDGAVTDAREHFIQFGYREGRAPAPATVAAPRPLPGPPVPGRFTPR
jgi:hypothetical protein